MEVKCTFSMRRLFRPFAQLIIVLALLLATAVTASAQNVRVGGKVVSATGAAMPGVSVTVRGTTIGIATNGQGAWELNNVPRNGVLEVSFLGYVAQAVQVSGQKLDYEIVLLEDLQRVDEVVVVGYGTQAKKDITGSVSVVSAEALKETPVATFAEALQGKAAGVYISSSGGPGAPSTIRIRGMGSLSGSSPLVIVDGISGVNIESINPNDIETIQVLKDASATAVYGAQGANGVIIITTRQGSRGGRVQITYDFYTGVSKLTNDGYNLLGAFDFMEFWRQGMINKRDILGLEPEVYTQFGPLDAQDQLTMPYATKPDGYSKQQIIDRWGSVDNWVASYKPNGGDSWARSAYYQMLEDGYSEAEAREGTDWYKLVSRTGKSQDHQISVMSGGDMGSFAASFGYTRQEGTFQASFFERYNLRVNSTYNLNKYVTIRQMTNLSLSDRGGETGGSNSDSNLFGRSFTTQSWLPVYNVGGDFAGPQSTGGGRSTTPVATIDGQKRDHDRNFRGQASFVAIAKPIEGLTITSQYSTTLTARFQDSFSPISIMYNKEGSSINSYNQQWSHNLSWQWTNYASYSKTFKDHSATLMVGSEAIASNPIGYSISATRQVYTYEDDRNTWTLDNGGTANQTNSGSRSGQYTMFGLFARGEYNYKDKYLVSFSVRRDGSSRFGSKNPWGTFPSISGGWRISAEPFMSSVQSWLDDLKLRLGYGTSGASNIDNYNWAFTYATGNGYTYGIDGVNTGSSTGFGASRLGDPNVKWETIRTLNIGADFSMFANRLSGTIEWYHKLTTDMLVPAQWSAQTGSASKPNVNFGKMENKGLELSINWRDRIGQFRYSVGFNASTVKNKVLRLDGEDLFNGTRITNTQVTRVGYPVGMFYGFNVLGIYKSADDVNNYKITTKEGEVKTVIPFGGSEDFNPDNWVGRYKIEDRNNNGYIDSGDNDVIGSPQPDWTGGINISLGYGQWDLNSYGYFTLGGDVFKMYEYYTLYGALQSNYSKDRASKSWHPRDNPNGKYPLWVGAGGDGEEEAGRRSNSMFLDDGSYFRLQSVAIGYTVPQNILQKFGASRLRIYGQVTNLFTITKYEGLDPEMNTGGTSDRTRNMDYGAYGMPRQFIFGLNLSF